MIKQKNSLKYQFILFFIICVILPILFILIFLSTFYKTKLQNQIITSTESTLQAVSNTLSLYIKELDSYTTIPYFNNRTLSAMKDRISGHYNTLSAYEKLLSDRDFESIIDHFSLEAQPDILSTLLICFDGSIAASTKKDGYLIENYSFSSQPWYIDAILANGRSVFTGNHNYNYFSYPSTNKAFSISRLIKDPNTQKQLGIIIASADVAVFDQLIRPINLGVSSFISILDNNNHVIYSSHELSPLTKKQLEADLTHISSDTDHFIKLKYPINDSPWHIIVLLSQSDLRNQVAWVYILAFCLGIFSCIFIWVVFFKFSTLVLEPFNQLKNIMEKVKQGDLSARFFPSVNNEVGMLGLELNDMIEKLDELIEQEYKIVLRSKISEYNALSSQIQPHFLFNTLNGFIGLNRLGKKQELEKAIFSLTSMLRYSLEHKDMVPIEDEFNFLKNYIDLQQLRFEDRFDASLICHPSVKTFSIPRLLLQPYVENAIIHGIEPSEEFCHLTINAKPAPINEQTFIHLCIKDTGIGFDKKTTTYNIGLQNCKERLFFTYPSATLDVCSEIGKGTTISILIPICKGVTQ